MRGNYESLSRLVEEVTRHERVKDDFVVPTSALTMGLDDRSLGIKNTGIYQIGDIAHNQIAQRLRIPKVFYDELPQRLPGLRAKIVNDLMPVQAERRMVRTLDGKARAFLSDRFAPYDNYDMLSTLIPVLDDFADLRLKSLTLTERRMYIQIVFPGMTAEIKVGDVVANGITLTNSEVGLGAWDVLEFMEILRCTNGMVGTSLMRKYHVGRRAVSEDEEGDGSYNIYQRDTIAADINATKLKLRDVVVNALNETRFRERVEKIKEADGQKIEKPVETIQKVTKRFNLGKGDETLILANLIKSGEGTRWGLSNAITAMAKEEKDQDRAFELEKIGNEVIQLSRSEWEEVAA